MKLNIGCGTDYRHGFYNIDGSDALPRVDKVINLSEESLLASFDPGCADFILANDIVEHFFHWEAVRLLQDCYALLCPRGRLEMRIPDAEFIINTQKHSVEWKLTWLFGGQDIPQGHSSKMDESRKDFPQFFCHKYGWTRKSMKDALLTVGFSQVVCERIGSNFRAVAVR